MCEEGQQLLVALSISPQVREWLTGPRVVSVLQVFDHACNLIDARGKVVALVTPTVGNGPFSIVVPPVCFSNHIAASSPVTIRRNRLTVGDLTIDVAQAADWTPRLDWDGLRDGARRVLDYLPMLQSILRARSPAESLAALVVELPPPESALQAEMLRRARMAAEKLTEGLLDARRDLCLAGAHELAGLGGGLTPAGDDWLVGCFLAARMVGPAEVIPLLQDMALAAAEITTPLSAAWLRAAARGEWGEQWHTLLAGIRQEDERAVYAAATAIAGQGHTSGSDALAGLVAVLAARVSNPGSPTLCAPG